MSRRFAVNLKEKMEIGSTVYPPSMAKIIHKSFLHLNRSVKFFLVGRLIIQSVNRERENPIKSRVANRSGYEPGLDCGK
jgi:hypothetical protein